MARITSDRRIGFVPGRLYGPGGFICGGSILVMDEGGEGGVDGFLRGRRYLR